MNWELVGLIVTLGIYFTGWAAYLSKSLGEINQHLKALNGRTAKVEDKLDRVEERVRALEVRVA